MHFSIYYHTSKWDQPSHHPLSLTTCYTDSLFLLISLKVIQLIDVETQSTKFYFLYKPPHRNQTLWKTQLPLYISHPTRYHSSLPHSFSIHGFSKPYQIITSHRASALCGTVLPKDSPREGAICMRP